MKKKLNTDGILLKNPDNGFGRFTSNRGYGIHRSLIAGNG